MISSTILICIYVQNYKGIATRFFIIGIFTCLDASIKYTVGKNADGSKGDVSVFLLFGLISVQGSSFLDPQRVAIGILSTSGLNQMRQNGKYTFGVKIGLNIAKLYQILLVLTPFGLVSFFVMLNKHTQFYRWAFTIFEEKFL